MQERERMIQAAIKWWGKKPRSTRTFICDEIADFALSQTQPLTAEIERLRAEVHGYEALREAVGTWCEKCPVEVQQALHQLPDIYKTHFAHDMTEPTPEGK